MKTCCAVLLNDEAVALLLFYLACRLGSLIEAAFLFVFFEAHPN